MGLSTLTKLFVVVVAVLLAHSAFAQLLIGVTRWRPAGPGKPNNPPAYQGPGDLLGGATAWYGLRAYNSVYAKAGGQLARLHRLSDDQQCDINSASNGGFGVTGNCDQVAANGLGVTAFCGATTCVIVAMYDQTIGNKCSAASCDLRQTIVSSQPTLMLNCLGTLPCVKLVGVQQFSTVKAFAQAQPFTVVVAADNQGVNLAETLAANGNEVQLGFNAFSAGDIYVTAGTLDHLTGYPSNKMLTFQFVANDPSSVLSVNSSDNSVTVGSNNFATSLNFGAMTGLFIEGGIWSTPFSNVQRVAMDSNIRTYWGF